MFKLTISSVAVPAKPAPDLFVFVLAVLPPAIILKPIFTGCIPGPTVLLRNMFHHIESCLRFILTLITKQFFVMSFVVQVQVTFTQSREFTFLALRHCSIHLVLNFPQMASQLSWSLHYSTTNVALIVLEAYVFGESSLVV